MMQQTKSLYLATDDVPGWLREHGASRHAGRDALLPGTTQTPTASRNMARDNHRWALASGQ